MPSNKRRKLEGLEATPQSAISALAARRRLANAAVPDASSSSEESDEPPPNRTNAFLALQNLSRDGNSPKSPKKSGAKTPPARGDAKRSTIASSGVEKSSTSDKNKASGSDYLSTEVVTYSSFRLSKQNCRTTSAGVVELRLKDSERFLLLGSFGIRVLTGEVTVLGATLRPSQQIHWIHAPLCHALPVLRTSEKTKLELHNDPTSVNLRRLDRLSPLFRRIWNEHVGNNGVQSQLNGGKTFQILCTSEDAPKKCLVQPLTSPPEWNKKLASLVTVASKSGPCTMLVCGPKSAGKSTFSKLLTNRLLTAEPSNTSKPQNGVAVLDLDPGQPEYAPPGTLSLVHVTQSNLGASFTHNSLDDTAFKVVRCHAVASITPASAPELYLECALDLLNTYRRSLRNCHLLINTPGWILGTGLDLLVNLIDSVSPQEVIYMSEDGPVDTVEALRGSTKKAFSTLPSQQSEFTSRTAAQFRAMQTMTYFHLAEMNSASINPRLNWNMLSLSSIPPWKVRYSGPHSGILGIISYDSQAPQELLAHTINGMVLAAVDIEQPQALRGPFLNRLSESESADALGEKTAALSSMVPRTAEGLPFIPSTGDNYLDPRFSRTVGLVLIRGIDVESQSLQVVTPIPFKKIESIRAEGRHLVLVHGNFDAPHWAYTEHQYEASGLDDGSLHKKVEIMSVDTSEDGEEDSGEDESSRRTKGIHVEMSTPWVEALRGNAKRPVGSSVWRVRRDLGRSSGD